MLDALSTVGNKSELLWFCGKGSPAGADCGHLALALGCSTGSRSLGAPYPAPSSTLPSRVGGGGGGGGRERVEKAPPLLPNGSGRSGSSTRDPE